MKYFIYIYIILYILYVVMGPHFIVKFIKGEKLDIAKSFTVILLRMIFLSYISLLYAAYYFHKPTSETFVNAVSIILIATIGFNIKWSGDKNYGTLVHALILLPVLISSYIYKIKISEFQFNNLSLFTTIMLIVYYFIQNKIYNLTD